MFRDPLEPLIKFIDEGGSLLEAQRITGIPDSTLANWYGRRGAPHGFALYQKLLMANPTLERKADELSSSRKPNQRS